MVTFYFNECIDNIVNKNILLNCFANCISDFNDLVGKNSFVQKYIVTEKLPASLFLNTNYSLSDLISEIEDKTKKRLAYIYFTKYPISDSFSTSDEEDLEILGEEYKLHINNDVKDATNLGVVSFKNGIAISLAIHYDLECNELKLIGKTKNINLSNFFGREDNTIHITQTISSIEISTLKLFEQLKKILGNAIISKKAEKEYIEASLTVQETINLHFMSAAQRNMQSPFMSDGDLIKDVSAVNQKIKLCELRIFKPFGIRVYFSEHNNSVYIINIGYKNGGDQDNDIKVANKYLERL